MRLPARLPHHCSGDTDTLGSVGRASAPEEAGRRDRGGMKVGESASANGSGRGEGEGWEREKQREKHREKQREREGEGEGEGEREREMVPPDAERDDTGTDCCQIRCQQQRRSLRDQGDSGNKDRTTGQQDTRTTGEQDNKTQDTGHNAHKTELSGYIAESGPRGRPEGRLGAGFSWWRHWWVRVADWQTGGLADWRTADWQCGSLASGNG